jgi:hypothetical protein
MRFQVLTAASMMFRAVFWVILIILHGSITQKTALNQMRIYLSGSVFLQFYPPPFFNFSLTSLYLWCRSYSSGLHSQAQWAAQYSLLNKHYPHSTRNKTATDWPRCVGPPVNTVPTDTSRQLGILSKFVGCRRDAIVSLSLNVNSPI